MSSNASGCPFQSQSNRRRIATDDQHERALHRLEGRVAKLAERVTRLEAQNIAHKLDHIMERLKLMPTKEEVVAQLETINTALQGVFERLDALDEDSDSITAAIDALKKQIEDGQTPDLSGIQAAADKLAATAESLRAKAGQAVIEPSGN